MLTNHFEPLCYYRCMYYEWLLHSSPSRRTRRRGGVVPNRCSTPEPRPPCEKTRRRSETARDLVFHSDSDDNDDGGGGGGGGGESSDGSPRYRVSAGGGRLSPSLPKLSPEQQRHLAECAAWQALFDLLGSGSRLLPPTSTPEEEVQAAIADRRPVVVVVVVVVVESQS